MLKSKHIRKENKEEDGKSIKTQKLRSEPNLKDLFTLILRVNHGKHATTHNIRQTHMVNEGCMAPKTEGNVFPTIQMEMPG